MRVYLRGIIERGSAVCGTGRNSTAKEGQRVVRLADRTRTAEDDDIRARGDEDPLPVGLKFDFIVVGLRVVSEVKR